MSVRDLLFLVLFFGCLPLCFFRPFFGILMWTVVSFVNPQAFTWTVIYDYQWGMLVAIPTLVGAAFFSRDWKNVYSRNIFLIVLLWIWFTFTTVNNTRMPVFAYFAAETWHRWQMVSKILLMAV